MTQIRSLLLIGMWVTVTLGCSKENNKASVPNPNKKEVETLSSASNASVKSGPKLSAITDKSWTADHCFRALALKFDDGTTHATIGNKTGTLAETINSDEHDEPVIKTTSHLAKELKFGSSIVCIAKVITKIEVPDDDESLNVDEMFRAAVVTNNNIVGSTVSIDGNRQYDGASDIKADGVPLSLGSENGLLITSDAGGGDHDTQTGRVMRVTHKGLEPITRFETGVGMDVFEK